MKRLTIGILLIFPLLVLGQDSIPRSYKTYINRNALLVGTSVAGFRIVYREPVTHIRHTATSFEIDPRVGWFFLSHSCIGAKGRYGATGGDLIDNFKFHSLGAFYRFYFFINGRDRFIQEGSSFSLFRKPIFSKTSPRGRQLLGLAFFPFVEAGFEYSNFKFVPRTGTVRVPRLSEPSIQLMFGGNLRFFKHFFLETTLIMDLAPPSGQDPWLFNFGRTIGLDFILPTKRPK